MDAVKLKDNQAGTTSSTAKDEKKSPSKSDNASGKKAGDSNAKGDDSKANGEGNKPLAPPPKPSQNGDGDYFSQQAGTSHYNLEPNLFEQSFGNPAPETPGKSLLPPVASLTSPAPLSGSAGLGGGYNWNGSLRSGPLSPAMLSGPTGTGDYFDSSLRGSLPTPNESSLRTGLTPGGGGSMFPAPSPSSQALFNQLATGGATPGTLDFQRTAMNAAAASKSSTTRLPATTAQPQVSATQAAAMNTTAPPQAATTAFAAQHDNEAANGLYLLAQAGNESQQNNQFAAANHTGKNGKQDTNASGSVGSGRAASETSEGDAKPNTRKSNKKGGKGANNKRKDQDIPAKQPAAKKAKSVKEEEYDDEDDDDSDDEPRGKNDKHKDPKKMTDEEKRKNFLERNRVAALKCRQRKKQWLQNLQAKVEIFSNENDALSAQVQSLREEVLNLKTILIAHKDCPISQQQTALGQYIQQQPPHEYQGAPNPYALGMQQGQPVMAGPPRRYS